MKTLYTIRREDWFPALGLGLIPEGSITEFGSIWVDLLLTDAQCMAYKNAGFGIDKRY